VHIHYLYRHVHCTSSHFSHCILDCCSLFELVLLNLLVQPLFLSSSFGLCSLPPCLTACRTFSIRLFDVRLYICIYRPHQLDAATTMLTISSMGSFWFASPIAMSDLRSQPPSGGFLPTSEHVELFQHAVSTHGDYIYHLPTSRLREMFLDAYTNTPVRESNIHSRLVPFDLPAQGFIPTSLYLRACRTFPTLLSDIR
jgi:hypothetical protein